MAKHSDNGREKPPASSPNHPQYNNRNYSHRGSGSGGVPPLDAFDNIPKRKPPDLPVRGYEAPPAMPQPTTTNGRKNAGKSQKKPAKSAGNAQQEPKRPKRKKRPVNPAKRRRNRRIAAVAAILVLIGAGIWYSINVLFKMENFAIENVAEVEMPYSEEEVLAAFPRQSGDNMFGFSVAAAQDEMQKRLPYLENVTIRRRLPNTVVFRVTPAVETYYMPWENQYAVLSGQHKVLRLVQEPQPQLILIEGLIGVEPVPGLPLSVSQQVLTQQAERFTQTLQAQAAPESVPEAESTPEGGESEAVQEDTAASSVPEGESTPQEGEPEPVLEAQPEQAPIRVVTIPQIEPEALLEEANLRFDSLASLQKELSNAGFENITWVNVENPLNITFRWEDRITVILGPKGDLGKKIAAAKMMLTDSEQSGITAGDRGTLDLSLYLTNKEMRFRPE